MGITRPRPDGGVTNKQTNKAKQNNIQIIPLCQPYSPAIPPSFIDCDTSDQRLETLRKTRRPPLIFLFLVVVRHLVKGELSTAKSYELFFPLSPHLTHDTWNYWCLIVALSDRKF